jgi:uncharacterized protein (DUF1684 family)
MHPDLQLADYRRYVAAMYSAQPIQGVKGWESFRRRRDQLFLRHTKSALTEEQRARTTQLPYFPYDPAARMVAILEPPRDRAKLRINTGGEDGILHYRRVGQLLTSYGPLTLFWLLGYGGGLFLPFKDATSGKETYGGGRYLTDTIKGTFGRGFSLKGDKVVVDFNYAYNPSCAYNSQFACPLAPYENWLKDPVRAGELAFPDPT